MTIILYFKDFQTFYRNRKECDQMETHILQLKRFNGVTNEDSQKLLLTFSKIHYICILLTYCILFKPVVEMITSNYSCKLHLERHRATVQKPQCENVPLDPKQRERVPWTSSSVLHTLYFCTVRVQNDVLSKQKAVFPFQLNWIISIKIPGFITGVDVEDLWCKFTPIGLKGLN